MKQDFHITGLLRVKTQRKFTWKRRDRSLGTTFDDLGIFKEEVLVWILWRKYKQKQPTGTRSTYMRYRGQFQMLVRMANSTDLLGWWRRNDNASWASESSGRILDAIQLYAISILEAFWTECFVSSHDQSKAVHLFISVVHHLKGLNIQYRLGQTRNKFLGKEDR